MSELLGGSLRIAVIILEFPALNETFILDHITGLLERGHDVRIFATAPKGEPKIHEEIQRYHLLERSGKGSFLFRSELGQPRFDSASIPMTTGQPLDRVIDYPLNVDGVDLKVTALQMGNPNCCIFVDDFDAIDWRRLGPKIENHPQFPERTNVIFIRVIDRAHIEERIWERGVGETESSGTCSCAAVVSSVINGECDRSIEVHAPGGIIPIEWRDDGEVVLTGTAAAVYSGEWLMD